MDTTVFEGARLIPGDGSAPIDNAVFLVESGQITEVGTAAEVTVPDGSTRVDLSGKTVMPLLITLHTHPGYARGVTFSEEHYDRDTYVRQLDTFLYYGLSAVVSMGVDRGDLAFELRDEQRNGTLGGAQLFTAGQGLAATDAGPQFPALKTAPRFVDTAEQGREAMRELAQRDPDMVKIWVDDRNGRVAKLPPDVYAAIIDEAHRHDIKVMAHVYTLEDAKGLVRAGVDGFAHLVRDEVVDDELEQLILEHDVFIVSNLNVQAHPKKNTSLDDPFLHESVSADEIAELRGASGEGRPVSDASLAIYRNMERSLVRLSEAGATIAFGSDSGIPRNFIGFSEHRELELMVAAGLSPLEAIRAVTATSAGILGLDDRGTLAPGMRADFMVLASDPLEDIKNTRTIEALYREGEKLDRDALRR